MMTLTKTYSIITEESAEHGDFAETGFEFKYQPATVRDVVDALRECLETSCVPLCETGHNCWASTNPEQDIFSGEWTTYTYHVEGVTPHQRRRLFRLAGLIK